MLAYNDAVFTEDDWRGIRMLQDSIKQDDPLKVGRFGLGFKSVFHLTGIALKFFLLNANNSFLSWIRITELVKIQV